MGQRLEDFLEASGEELDTFAARAGVEPHRLYAIVTGEERADLTCARRIVLAAGGGLALEDILDGADGADIIDGDFGAATEPLDVARLSLAVAPELQGLGPEFCEAAVEAIANTYDALGPVTSRQGPDRLLQALRAVLEEIRRECGVRSPQSEIETAARLSARRYFG